MRALDRALPPATLTPAALIAAAGPIPEDMHEPLARLCRAIDDEAALTPTGRWMTRFRLVDTLRARIAVEAAPAAPTLPPPVVVTGLQRTGTTLLHRLLAADPRARSVRSWEALRPAPGRGRRGASVRAAGLLRWMAPDFFAVHPIDPDASEEEVVILGHTLRSTVDEAILRVPSYAAWLETQDQTPAYAYLRRALRVLQAQAAGEWLVLKTPHHLEWLDTLLAVFPDARIVWTHRDPAETLASFCSMVAHGRGVFSDRVDPHEIGREWLRKCARMVERGRAARAAAPDRFLDVDYRALVADPARVVAEVYAFAGLPWDPRAQQGVRAALDVHVQHRFGRHVYALSDFGLTADEVRSRLA